MGSMERPMAVTVSRGVYRNIIASAAAHITAERTMAKTLDRYPFSMAAASLLRAEIYRLVFSPEKAEMLLRDIRWNT